jgi:hypothetical protein
MTDERLSKLIVHYKSKGKKGRGSRRRRQKDHSIIIFPNGGTSHEGTVPVTEDVREVSCFVRDRHY